MTPPPPGGPTRRGVLIGAALGAVALAGCSRGQSRQPNPREALLQETLALENQLIAACDAALADAMSGSALGQALAHVRADHAVHRDTLLAAGAEPGASPTPTTTTAVVNRRRTLIAAETAAAAARIDACVRGPLDLAPLLASLSASESAHAALLRATR